MSWYYNNKRICKECENEFKQSEDTLSIVSKDYGKCPKCGSMNTEITKNEISINQFIENLKTIYKTN